MAIVVAFVVEDEAAASCLEQIKRVLAESGLPWLMTDAREATEEEVQWAKMAAAAGAGTKDVVPAWLDVVNATEEDAEDFMTERAERERPSAEDKVQGGESKG